MIIAGILSVMRAALFMANLKEEAHGWMENYF